MGSLDPAKIAMILVIAAIVLGPERLPRVARQLGSAWRELTKIRDQVTEEVRSAIPDIDLPRVPTMAPGTISGFLSGRTAIRPEGSTNVPDSTGQDGETAPEGGQEESHPRSVSASSDELESVPGAYDRHSTLVMYPSPGEFSFIADDPSMN